MNDHILTENDEYIVSLDCDHNGDAVEELKRFKNMITITRKKDLRFFHSGLGFYDSCLKSGDTDIFWNMVDARFKYSRTYDTDNNNRATPNVTEQDKAAPCGGE